MKAYEKLSSCGCAVWRHSFNAVMLGIVCNYFSVFLFLHPYLFDCIEGVMWGLN